MAITKEKKQSLINEYVQDLQEAKNLVLIKQSGLPVSTDTEVRRFVREENGKFNVIRKRLFLRSLKEAGYPDLDPSQFSGSAVSVYAKGDEYAPLKIINKYLKSFQKAKDSTASFEFLGGYFNKEWKDAAYVSELANMPSRDELLSKLVWLFNYPVQSFTSVLDQIAKKNETGGVSLPSVEEVSIAVEEKKDVVEETNTESTQEAIEETPAVVEENIPEATE